MLKLIKPDLPFLQNIIKMEINGKFRTVKSKTMKKLSSFIILCYFGISLTAQDPPAGGQQIKQTPDRLIPLDTKNTSLVFRINGRDGRLYQSYFGAKLKNPDNLSQIRDAGHLAYATFGTDNLFEPAIRATHNDGNPSLELKYVNQSFEKSSWRKK